jgi:hypothetical protein
VIFAIELDRFAVGTIIIPTHTKHVPTLVCYPNIFKIKLVLKQLVKLIYVLVVKLTIPPNTIKQHLPKTFSP